MTNKKNNSLHKVNRVGHKHSTVINRKILKSPHFKEKIFSENLKKSSSSDTFANDYFKTENKIYPPLKKEESNKLINKNRTKKEIPKVPKELYDNFKYLTISEKTKNSNQIRIRVKEKSKKSICTISTNTSDLTINKKFNKIEDNITIKKFKIAQDKWKNDYFAKIIQKIFRGYYFRKNFEKNKNCQILYHKKKIHNSFKSKKLNINSNIINKNNFYNINNNEPAIKTIFIESFHKTNYINNDPKKKYKY